MTRTSDYAARINRAIDHILTHLSQSLKLEDIARVAHFSPFHFHRVFKALLGETLGDFIKRVRLERALYLLAHRRNVSMTEVALACGFVSSSNFSRSFKQRYGIAPSAFDLDHFRKNRREEMQAALTPPKERHLLARLSPGENPDGFEVQQKRLPARRIAYLRVHRPYEGDRVMRAAQRMVAWAEDRGIADGNWLGYTWDDPDIVPLEKCRYDVGVEVPMGFGLDESPGEIGSLELGPLWVAELQLNGPIELEQRALDWLYGTWLPSSGCAPADQPCFEAWNGRPFETLQRSGEARFHLKLQLPLADLRIPI